jgi:hypothetical protein
LPLGLNIAHFVDPLVIRPRTGRSERPFIDSLYDLPILQFRFAPLLKFQPDMQERLCFSRPLNPGGKRLLKAGHTFGRKGPHHCWKTRLYSVQNPVSVLVVRAGQSVFAKAQDTPPLSIGKDRGLVILFGADAGEVSEHPLSGVLIACSCGAPGQLITLYSNRSRRKQ